MNQGYQESIFNWRIKVPKLAIGIGLVVIGIFVGSQLSGYYYDPHYSHVGLPLNSEKPSLMRLLTHPSQKWQVEIPSHWPQSIQGKMSSPVSMPGISRPFSNFPLREPREIDETIMGKVSVIRWANTNDPLQLLQTDDLLAIGNSAPEVRFFRSFVVSGRTGLEYAVYLGNDFGPIYHLRAFIPSRAEGWYEFQTTYGLISNSNQPKEAYRETLEAWRFILESFQETD